MEYHQEPNTLLYLTKHLCDTIPNTLLYLTKHLSDTVPNKSYIEHKHKPIIVLLTIKDLYLCYIVLKIFIWATPIQIFILASPIQNLATLIQIFILTKPSDLYFVHLILNQTKASLFFQLGQLIMFSKFMRILIIVNNFSNSISQLSVLLKVFYKFSRC